MSTSTTNYQLIINKSYISYHDLLIYYKNIHTFLIYSIYIYIHIFKYFIYKNININAQLTLTAVVKTLITIYG